MQFRVLSHRFEFLGESPHQFANVGMDKVRSHGLLVQFGYIQKIRQQILGTFQRPLHTLNKSILVRRQIAVHQGGHQ